MLTTKQTKQFIRQPYAWPGGYPMALLMDDGGILCKTCSRSEWRQICDSIRTECRDGWLPEAVYINWESEEYCDHCNEQIETAYGIHKETN